MRVRWTPPFIVLMLVVVATASCAAPPARAPIGPAGGTTAGAAPAAPSQPSRTLAIAVRVEATNLAAKPLRMTGITLGFTTRLFNAGLAITDDRGLAQPYLAEALPVLNSDTWKVNADGTMETSYRLKPNLAWHDGQPLTADDFVFAWRVYTVPDFGLAASVPQGLMGDVQVTDPRTFTIRWKRSYPFAGAIEASGQRNLPPLPRHLLEQPLQQLAPDAFAALPYWTTEYVGLGPYKLERWEPGAFIEAGAFDSHALSRPKIDRLQLRFINDANTALSNVLSGAVQLLADDAVYFQQATVLKREWANNQAGAVLVTPGLWRYTQIQLSPEYNNARPLLDLRVRKALAYGLDKQAINDGIYEGEGIDSDSIIPPTADYYAVVDRAVVKHPFDPRRSEQLMAEAGFTRGGDGFFTGAPTGRFSPELKVIQNAQNEAEQAVMAAGWRQVGFDVQQAVLPAAQAQDAQTRATFPSMFTVSAPVGESTLSTHGTAGTPRPENRWNGFNRSAWSNAEYDRLVDAYNTTFDRNERIQQIARMVAIFSEELPAIAINFNPAITAHTAALRGPQVVGPDGAIAWNVQTWELR